MMDLKFLILLSTLPVLILTDPSKYRIVAMNMWDYGSRVDNGIEKVNPDIILLQEVSNIAATNRILQGLQRAFNQTQTWSLCGSHSNTYSRIISRFPIHKEIDHNLNLMIGATNCILEASNGSLIDAWSIHLFWNNYGPYGFCLGISGCNASQPTQCETSVLRNEEVRSNEIKQILAAQDKNPKSDLVIIGGDFNTPSHLDYTEATRASHCGVGAFAWPVSVRMEKAGFMDAYRQVYPDPAMHPGNTWSTFQKDQNDFECEDDIPQAKGKPEPQDRIDMVYVKGSTVSVESAKILPGPEEAAEIAEKYQYRCRGTSNYRNSPYPSDHFAVFTEIAVEV